MLVTAALRIVTRLPTSSYPGSLRVGPATRDWDRSKTPPTAQPQGQKRPVNHTIVEASRSSSVLKLPCASEPVEKLAVIALIGACITMQLVLARAPEGQGAPAERVFDEAEIEVLHALQAKLQGRTDKQRNPYRPGTLAWASWTIARLGGWTGYKSDRSTGPITMRDGLERFNSLVDGYHLAKNVCAS